MSAPDHNHSSQMLHQQQKPQVCVEVRNFGPIASGKVDIRPLTVFAGPSNAGKSWLAILIYAMRNALPHGAIKDQRASVESLLPTIQARDNLARMGMPFFPEKHELWADAMEGERELVLSKNEMELVGLTARDFESVVDYELLRCYGMAEPKEAARWGAFGKAEVSLQIGGMRHVVNVDKEMNKTSLTVRVASDAVMDFSAEWQDSTLKLMLPSGVNVPADENRHAAQFNEFGSSHNLAWCMDHLYRQGRIGNVHYIPADRGGIMRTRTAIAGALIKNASHGRIGGDQRLPELSGVLGDFMKRLLEMTEADRSAGSPAINLDQGLTESVLSGTVEVDRQLGGYPRFVYCPSGRNERVSLGKASSMVSEMGPLALFLKHIVSPGDLLILEQPEAHLHPEQQRLLMVEVAKWTKQGVRVLLTTNSDWIVSELSNQVARGIGRDSDAVNQEENALNREDVGVWRFEWTKESAAESGSSITEVEWDPYGAGYETGFYDVFVNQNNEWAAIMDRFNWKEESHG